MAQVATAGKVAPGPGKKKGWWSRLSPEAKAALGLTAVSIPLWIYGARRHAKESKQFWDNIHSRAYSSARGSTHSNPFSGGVHYEDPFEDAYRRARERANAAGSAFRMHTAHEAAHTAMPELRNVKTKVEAKKVYHGYVRRFHPDVATSDAQRAEFTERLKNINPSWEQAQKSDWFSKLAQVGYWQMLAEYLTDNNSAEEA